MKSISVTNYRSFGEGQDFEFPGADYKKPVAIVGYNNCGKTNLMNAILYGVGEKFVSEKTFESVDLHNLDYSNNISIISNIDASIYGKTYFGKDQTIAGIHTISSTIEDGEIKSALDNSFFGANKHYGVFYVNFHNIKEEIATQKTSWGNIRSFLGKHIQKLVESDATMSGKKGVFESEVNMSTDKVLEHSELNKFIERISANYSTNLRNNDCEVEFGLPSYEDIFLKMMFKIGLNGDSTNLIPIDHFGDGFISMFVMAVIQAIAESSEDNKCLFLFEEPESFLHENHQEYFYKTVLCSLSENGHQVIYTTHSDKMIDPFDTKGLIRLELDESNQTVCKYNETGEFDVDEDTGEVIDYSRYNEFIKTVEPNLNRILFSKKVILVEGPNDVLVYKYAINQMVLEYIEANKSIVDKTKFADTFMNFENISIVCHHGKATALYLIKLCKHFKVDFFVINDWDFEEGELDINAVYDFEDLDDLKDDVIYTGQNSTKRGMITTNWNLLDAAGMDNIHFNVKKLETVINYGKDDKSSLSIWDHINDESFEITDKLFPSKLDVFLGLEKFFVESPQEDTQPDLFTE